MKKWLWRYRTELGLYGGFLLVSFLLFGNPHAPQIFPEEAGYLGWANRLLYGQGSGYYFLPGYSLLLLPLMAVCNDITVIYPYLIAENILLNGLLVIGFYRLLSLWGIRGRKGALGATVLSLYAPFFLYSRRAICEPLVQVCFVFLLLAVARLFETKGKKGLISAVLLTVILLITHSRELVVLGVWLILLLVCFRRKKQVWWIGGGICFIGGLGLFWAMTDTGVAAVHLQEQLLTFFSVHGIRQLLMTLLTQSSYWILSTLGLAPAGIWYGIKLVKKRGTGWQTSLFALLFFGATALLSALFMSHHSKAIQLLYGRYNDGALAGIFVLGLVAYLKEKPPAWLWGLCVGDLILTGALYGEKLHQLTGDIMNALGLFVSRLLAWQFDFWITSVFFLLLGLVFWGLRRKKGEWGLVFLGLLFFLHLIYITVTFFIPENKREDPSILRVLEQGNGELYCQKDEYVRELYRYSVYLPSLSWSDSEGGIEVSKTWKEDGILLGAEDGTFLWARDEEAAQNYKHLQLPVDGIIINPKSEITLVKATGSEVTVQVKNTGSPWLCTNAVRDIQKSVRLGIRFFDKEGNLVEEQRRDFGDNMLSGDVQEFSVAWNDRAETVSFELVQEFRNWFSQLGDEGALTLNRQGEPIPYPDTDNRFRTLSHEFLIETKEKEALPNRNNLVGFYGNWTGAESSYRHIRLDCTDARELVIKPGEGDRSNPTLSIILNESVVLTNPVIEQGEYRFSLNDFEGTIETITLRCDPYNGFEESGLPKWMSFLSLDSPLRPVQFAVHRIRDIFGVDANNHDFGIPVEAITVR